MGIAVQNETKKHLWIMDVEDIATVRYLKVL